MPSCWVNNTAVVQERPSWDVFNGDDCCTHGDIALEGHMCYSLHNLTKVDYYVAGCVNKNFDGCPQVNWCSEYNQPAGATWIDADSKWKCCGTGNLGQPSCNPASGPEFTGPQSGPYYDNYIDSLHKIGVAAIVGIAIGAFAFVAFVAIVLWCCCCSKRARDKRSRGKFVPLGSGRDMPGDNVVWNSNVHDGGHELHDGPMGGYAAPPHGPGVGHAPQYTVQGFR